MNLKDKLNTWLPTGGYQTETIFEVNSADSTSHRCSFVDANVVVHQNTPELRPNSRHDFNRTDSEQISWSIRQWTDGPRMWSFCDVPDSQPVPFLELCPWVTCETQNGTVYELPSTYPISFRHGNTLLADALLHPAVSLPTLTSDPRLAGFRTENAIFLDIEATGLSHGAGTYAFLIGLGEFGPNGDFLIRQLVLDDPGNEAAILSRLAEHLARFDYIVSFNGKSYDLSVLQNRMIMHRFYSPNDVELKLTPHLDLVHLYRSIWKRAFPDCRLQTLEKRVLNFVRQDDVPGELVPTLYFQYLHRMDARPLSPILDHNRYDVLSMAALVAKLLHTINNPDQLDHPEAAAGLAVLLTRRGDSRQALSVGMQAIDRSLSDTTQREIFKALVTCCKRLGDTAKLIEILERYCRIFPTDPEPWMQLGFCHERWTKDVEAAYRCTQQALHLLPSSSINEQATIERRLIRLQRKLGFS